MMLQLFACADASDAVRIDADGLAPNENTSFTTLTFTTPNEQVLYDDAGKEKVLPSVLSCEINAEGTISHNYEKENLFTDVGSEQRIVVLNTAILAADLENFTDDAAACTDESTYTLTYAATDRNFTTSINCLGLATSEVQDVFYELLELCSFE